MVEVGTVLHIKSSDLSKCRAIRCIACFQEELGYLKKNKEVKNATLGNTTPTHAIVASVLEFTRTTMLYQLHNQESPAR